MRTLVLGGGGSKGSWSCGCINHLLGDLEIKYDIICGVSVGAINGAFLAQYSHGEEKLASSEMKNMWLQINTSKIYKSWKPFGMWHALWQSSFYDSSPLNKLIKKHISLDKIRKSGKQVYVGVVSLSSGKYHVINQNNDDFIDYVIASASFPVMLSSVRIGNQLWSDGGSKEITPLRTAIDMGATEIDVIITSPEHRVKLFFEKPNTIDILKRSFDLSSDKIMSNDIEKVLIYNKLAERGDTDRKVVKMNVIRPKHNLIEDLLDFTPHKIREMIKAGYEDAKRSTDFNKST